MQAAIKDKISPIVATVTYKLLPEGRSSARDGNPDTTQSLFPVLRSQAYYTNSSQVVLAVCVLLMSVCLYDVYPDCRLTCFKIAVMTFNAFQTYR